MNLQTQIRQQQSTVQMLEKLLKVKRCSQEQVDQAQRRLVDLQEQENFKPLVQPEADPASADRPEGSFVQNSKPEAVPSGRAALGRRIEGDEYASIQADLSRQADGLNRKMADLSNKLHQIPPTAPCPELTRQILSLKAEIETIWDKKRYLERNRVMPEEDPQQAIDLPILEESGRFQLAYEKRRLIDLRSKLRRKLNDPKAKPGKVHEWETELAQCELKIQEIELKLC